MAERKIAGTGETYTGMVIKLGEFEYTTIGGGIEGDRQQLAPMDTSNDSSPPMTTTSTINANSPLSDFEFLEDYDIGTGDGILKVNDVVYWNELGRSDIASFITQFLTSGDFPPSRTTTTGNEDVVTPFVVGDGSIFGNGAYFYADGSTVPAGTELHHHTIIPQGRTSNFMTQHVMDGNDVDVFTNIGGQANNQTTNQQNQQGGGMNGNGGNGGNTGGNTGGGPSY